MNAHEARIRECVLHGPGRHRAYRPWLTVRQVRSLGLRSRPPGRACGRVMHLFSKLELWAFYLLDYLPKVVDLREQFPLLPFQLTREIASDLGIRHPRAPRGMPEPWVLTTDFCATIETPTGPVDRLICVKYSRDLRNVRTQRVLELERTFWQEQGVSWSVLTEREMPRRLVANLAWLYPFYLPPELAPELPGADVERAAFELLRRSDAPLCDGCLRLDRHFGLRRGSTLALARRRLAERQWECDLLHTRLALGPVRDLRLGSGFPPPPPSARS